MADPVVHLRLGRRGEITLPEDALHALGAKPGDRLKLRIDSRHKVLHLERHVDDPWEEALQEKKAPDFEELMTDQQKRDAEAKRLFEERLEGRGKGPAARPEERPDSWR